MIKLLSTDASREATAAVLGWLDDEIHRVLPMAVIEHIGSTAVPGAVTKGDVDVQVAAEASMFAVYKTRLDSCFAHNPGMEPTETFVSYSGWYRDTGFGIQLVVQGETEFNFVKWRDALMNSPDLLARYNRLKQKMASKSEDEYRQAKYEFIEQALIAFGVSAAQGSRP